MYSPVCLRLPSRGYRPVPDRRRPEGVQPSDGTSWDRHRPGARVTRPCVLIKHRTRRGDRRRWRRNRTGWFCRGYRLRTSHPSRWRSGTPGSPSLAGMSRDGPHLRVVGPLTPLTSLRCAVSRSVRAWTRRRGCVGTGRPRRCSNWSSSACRFELYTITFVNIVTIAAVTWRQPGVPGGGPPAVFGPKTSHSYQCNGLRRDSRTRATARSETRRRDVTSLPRVSGVSPCDEFARVEPTSVVAVVRFLHP